MKSFKFFIEFLAQSIKVAVVFISDRFNYEKFAKLGRSLNFPTRTNCYFSKDLTC